MRYCRQVFAQVMLLSLLIMSSPHAFASPLDLQLNTIEYINGLTFYPDGTYSLNNATGSLFITNPSLNHTVADININFSSGITPSSIHINELGYNNTTIVSYQVASSAISLPISVVETITPATLKQGKNQTIVFDATISNSGSENISIVQFDKVFPSVLNFMNITTTNGSINFTNNTVTWTNITIQPASSENIQILFYTSPASSISIPTSNLSFTLPTYSASTTLSLSAVTTTTNFTLEKEKLSQNRWRVGVRVRDESEFNYSLYRTEIYLSDTMLNSSVLIKTYNPNITLQPGQSWYDEFYYDYSGVPVFFTRIYYTVSFNLSGSSMPVTPIESGGYIINSAVSAISREDHHSHRKKVVQDENGDDGDTADLTVTFAAPQPDDGSDKRIPITTVPVLISMVLAFLLAGGFITTVPHFTGSRIVMSGSSLMDLAGIIGYSSIFSSSNSLLIGRSDLENMLDNSAFSQVSTFIDNDLIKTTEFNTPLMDDIIREYEVERKDAQVLAAALSTGSKRVVLTSVKGRNTAKMLGLAPMSAYDFITDEYMKDRISMAEFEKMMRTLIYNGKHDNIFKSSVVHR